MATINKQYFIDRNWEEIPSVDEYSEFRERDMKDRCTFYVHVYNHYATVWFTSHKTFIRDINSVEQFENLYHAIMDDKPKLHSFPRKILLEKKDGWLPLKNYIANQE